MLGLGPEAEENRWRFLPQTYLISHRYTQIFGLCCQKTAAQPDHQRREKKAKKNELFVVFDSCWKDKLLPPHATGLTPHSGLPIPTP